MVNDLSNIFPFVVKNINFKNTDYENNLIDNYSSSFQYNKVKYICPRINITSLSSKTLYIDLELKYIKPNGGLERGNSSPRNYTTKVNVKISKDTKNLNISCWGSKQGGVYPIGQNKVEIYYKGNLLGTGSFQIYR